MEPLGPLLRRDTQQNLQLAGLENSRSRAFSGSRQLNTVGALVLVGCHDDSSHRPPPPYHHLIIHHLAKRDPLSALLSSLNEFSGSSQRAD